MVCHHLDAGIAEDLAFAESRIRRETIAAEDILHDLGAISIMASDSQAMGRVGEVDHPHLADGAQDEGAARRPLRAGRRGGRAGRATTTSASSATSPSTPSTRRIAHGIAHEVGSVEVGKWADLVLWRPAFFGVKPSLVLKGGFIAAAAMGDPNASIPTPQPVHYRPDVRQLRRRAAGHRSDLRQPGRAARRHRRRTRPAQAPVGRARLPHGEEGRHGAQRATCR